MRVQEPILNETSQDIREVKKIGEGATKFCMLLLYTFRTKYSKYNKKSHIILVRHELAK